MPKLTLLRLPDWAAEEIEKIASKKGHPFVTVVRDIVIDGLNRNVPGTPSARINEPGTTTSSGSPEAAHGH